MDYYLDDNFKYRFPTSYNGMKIKLNGLKGKMISVSLIDIEEINNRVGDNRPLYILKSQRFAFVYVEV